MRQVGTLATQQDAERFADYLVTLGVPSRVDAAPDGFSVWAIEENDVARAKQTLGEFQANPTDPRYAAAHATAEELRATPSRRSAARPSAGSSTSASVGTGPSGARFRLPCSSSACRSPRRCSAISARTVRSQPLADAFQLGHESQRAVARATLAAVDADVLARLSAPPDLRYVLALHARAAIEIRRGAGFGRARSRHPIGGHVGTSPRRPAELRRLLGCRLRTVWLRLDESRYDPAAGLFLDSRTVMVDDGAGCFLRSRADRQWTWPTRRISAAWRRASPWATRLRRLLAVTGWAAGSRSRSYSARGTFTTESGNRTVRLISPFSPEPLLFWLILHRSSGRR